MPLLAPSAELLPAGIGPYAALIVIGFALGILGHLSRSRWLVTIGIICIFLGALLFPLLLGLTGNNPPRVPDSPSR